MRTEKFENIYKSDVASLNNQKVINRQILLIKIVYCQQIKKLLNLLVLIFFCCVVILAQKLNLSTC